MTVVSLAVLDLLARLKTFSELIARHGVIMRQFVEQTHAYKKTKSTGLF